MRYVTTTSGERRRVHREYVDVYCRMGRDGQILPVRVLWRDARCVRGAGRLLAPARPSPAPCGGARALGTPA